MENLKQTANQLLNDFKGDNYISGIGVINKIGAMVSAFGKKVTIFADGIDKEWAKPILKEVEDSLLDAGVLACTIEKGAKPNAPREDVKRIARIIELQNPDVVLSVGGGSTIDAVKAAIAYCILGDNYPDLDDYFGMGQITNMLASEKKKLIPHVAVMVASSSAAHLTKYSNITDILTGQKLLIVDTAVVPDKALFDYSVTTTQRHSLTVDGALDGISHSLEVFMGIPQTQMEKAMPVCLSGIELIVGNLKQVVKNPDDISAREAIGLGTDLGGYAIMIGGTNGAHLNSFSMTDILSHGRACALMNPYYVVFFAPAIEDRLRMVGVFFQKAGYISENLSHLSGRALGLAIAKGMFKLSEEIGFPTTLAEVPGFSEKHIIRCLEAAKNPKLDSKLKNMPVPLSAETIDAYMGPILQAAKTGNLDFIKNI
jgi:alcohol dehydrogenase class IV